ALHSFPTRRSSDLQLPLESPQIEYERLSPETGKRDRLCVLPLSAAVSAAQSAAPYHSAVGFTFCLVRLELSTEIAGGRIHDLPCPTPAFWCGVHQPLPEPQLGPDPVQVSSDLVRSPPPAGDRVPAEDVDDPLLRARV